jgi:Tfp pilus assembly PilM family ATPase
MVGLSLEDREVQGVIMHRAGSGCKIIKTFHFSLSLDPLTNDPELVGREIRQHLDEAGVHERHCVVCLPLGWVLTLGADIPEIPEADVKGFLQLEAEQGFPHSPSDLVISTSRFVIPNQQQHALMAAVPANHVNALKKALVSARLMPLSFSLGITNLENSGFIK